MQTPMNAADTSASAVDPMAAGPTASAASRSLQMLAVRQQAKLELRAALRQMQCRGLNYAAKWAAELLCEIDLDAVSTNTSTLTSNMHSRLASHSKPSRLSSANRVGSSAGAALNNTGGMPPPSFDEATPAAGTGNMQHPASRRHTISTKLFATPSAADSTPARSAFAGPSFLQPLSAMSPILATPQSRNSSSSSGSENEHMRDSSAPPSAAAAASAQRPPHSHQRHSASSISPGGADLLPPPTLESLQAVAALGPLHLPVQLVDPAPSSDGRAQAQEDQILLAKTYFDLKEFQRAAFVLRDVQILPGAAAPAPVTSPSSGPGPGPVAQAAMSSCPNGAANRALFLRCYSLYLAGEKRKEEEIMEKSKGGSGGGGGNGGAAGMGGAHSLGIGGNGSNGGADGDSSDRSRVCNRELRGLQIVLSSVLVRDSTTLSEDGSPLPGHPLAPFIADGHLWFLYGLVLRELGLRSAARNALLVSVATFPWNWGAWQALAGFVAERSQLDQVMTFMHERAADQMSSAEVLHAALAAECATRGTPAPAPLAPHAAGVWMKDLFQVEVLLALQANAEAESLQVLDNLCAIFPDSMHVRTTSAMAYYNKREFSEAQHLFELVQHLDPYRLDHMDTYSNILFVHGERAKLSSLAHSAHQTDKYRVQTCCIVGNYYSMRGSHERAIVYFQRALVLDPAYLSAWTLMGHEYVELRNTNMAIESYRKALDINPLDFRAWYGLGQTYEILQMNKYSLYYFKKACEIKPYDPRLWCALGENYEKLSLESLPSSGGSSGGVSANGGHATSSARLLESALKCYRKAEGNHDADGLALHKLARLYRRRGQTAMAAEYYRKVLLRHEGTQAIEAMEASDDVDREAQETDLDASMATAAAAAAGGGGGAAAASSSALSHAPLHADAVDSLLFLAEYYFRTHHAYTRAEAYCNRLLDMGGNAREAAKSLLMEIRQIKNHQANQLAAKQKAAAAAAAKQQQATAAAAVNASTTSFAPLQRTPMQRNDSRAQPPPSAAPAASSSASFAATPQRSPIQPANQSQLSSPGFFDSPAPSP